MGLCLLGLPGCSGLAVLLPGPLPAQPLLLQPLPAAAATTTTAWGSHEGPGILAGVGRQQAVGGAPEKAANVNQKRGTGSEEALHGLAWGLGVAGSGGRGAGGTLSSLCQKLRAPAGK